MKEKQHSMHSEIEIKKQVEACIAWIQQQVKKANCNGALVGLSGGIDSAVVANLLVRAFPENSLGVILPIDSNRQDALHAQKVAETCKIINTEIELTMEKNSIMNKTREALSAVRADQHKNPKLSDGNLRARLRMAALYTMANEMNYLVVGTDNKAELYTGYFTKYGDGGVDILPLASLLKNEVYLWGKYLNVPMEIIHKDPSAGLWEGQSDEEEMGITYETIDRFLRGENISDKDEEIIKKLHATTEHKRQMPPIYSLV